MFPACECLDASEGKNVRLSVLVFVRLSVFVFRMFEFVSESVFEFDQNEGCCLCGEARALVG